VTEGSGKGIKAAVIKENVGSSLVKMSGPFVQAKAQTNRKVHGYEHTLHAE
jgi:hypothetical protein